MTDRTSGSGDGGYPTGRFSRMPDANEDERTTRDPRAEERLPGEPAPGAAAGEGRIPGDGIGRTGGATAAGRTPGATGPGRDGLTGDDRAPGPGAVPPPGPAGLPAYGETERPGTESEYGTAGRPPHGTEGLRPGTEDLGRETPGATRAEDRRMPDDGLGAANVGAGTAGATAAAPQRGRLPEDGRMPEDGLGVPAAGEVSGRESATGNGRGTDSWPSAPGAAGPRDGHAGHDGGGAPLLPHAEADEWEQRMRQVVAGFVDQPRAAVEEADHALEEITARFTEAVTRRRHTLRSGWQGGEEHASGAGTDTEQLRLALRDYRELADRLLHL
ncbi:hypothetical protein NX794_08540 [Streptomyces sp. LP11]|uniref:Uncharacterized protein n=1 Tax=Streptomyces pyxinicus TaxID=2970331 RepID=A0ABT2AYE5_9ACTN|nr:hypothetical protein [Streptomyces sp. LP11]MCS0601277.1 hypothetical protein [Streptomyces sp. LP11]